MLAETTSPQIDTPVVLVIDDDPLITVVLKRALQGLPHELYTAVDGASGVAEVEARRPDLIILDNVLPDGLGVDALERIHDLAPDTPVLVITAKGSGDTAIKAMKGCAFDYLPKPLEPTRLRSLINRALSLRSLLKSHSPDATSIGGIGGAAVANQAAPVVDALPDQLIGQCPAMQGVFKAIGRVAGQEVTVLIRGENGTGKEAVAREIHRHSSRSDHPLVQLHCRGLDERRLERMLFGETANGDSQPGGRLAEADGGTLVLQEVGAFSLPLQAKLLRAVRDRVYEPADSGATLPVRCRVLAITSEDLEAKARDGGFRSDLYYALSSFVVTLPPLRQRHGDLPLLIEQTLGKLSPIADAFGVERPLVSEAAMKALCSHLWPGNIDELESVLKRALVEQKGNVLLAADLMAAIAGESVVNAGGAERDTRYVVDWSRFSELRIEAGGDTLHADAIAETERHVFECVLKHTAGNQAHAARILGITRASLRKKLRLYGMAPRPLQE